MMRMALLSSDIPHFISGFISFSLTHLFHSRIGAIENQLDFIHSGMFGGLLFSHFLLYFGILSFFFIDYLAMFKITIYLMF